MTFSEYISNPAGVKNSVYSHREMYMAMYTDKLNKILVRENGDIKYEFFKSKDKYYIYFKIPSEVVDKFYYDVVVEFYPKDVASSLKKTLKDYCVRFFSNDPAFVYTFAHAFIKNDMFIKDLEPRMTKDVIKHKAEERNPKDEIGYVKSIFFAYLIMENRGLFNKIKFDFCPEYDKKYLLSKIMNADEKIKLRQEEAQSLGGKKKQANQSQSHPETDNVSKSRISNKINSLSNFGRMHTTAKTPVMKSTTKSAKSRGVKKTKRI